MYKNSNWTVVFLFISIAFFSGGSALQSIFEYSPIFGSLLGIISLLTATVFAFKRYMASTKK
jgi:putative effector of murein hydrolase